MEQLDMLRQENIDGLLDALHPVFELPDPIHADADADHAMPAMPAPAEPERVSPFREKIQTLFTDSDVQVLLHDWVKHYASWNWEQLLSIFEHEIQLEPEEEPEEQEAQQEVAQVAQEQQTQAAQAQVDQQQAQAEPRERVPREVRVLTKKQMLVAKGNVQSGKSKFMIIMNILLASLGFRPVFVLRNFSDDVNQLFENFESEKRDALRKQRAFPFGLECLGKREKSRAKYVVYVALSNVAQLRKIKSLERYCLTIDEVDTVDSGELTAKVKLLTELKADAMVVLGVSATIMDALIKDEIRASQFIQLPTPDDYKGISSISVETIEGEYTGTMKASIIREENADLYTYVDAFSQRSAMVCDGVYVPHISLITVARCIEPNRELQDMIRQRYPSIVSILVTGEEIRMAVDGVMYVPRLYQREQASCVMLPGRDEVVGWMEKRQKPSIRGCIQWCKNQGNSAIRFPRILIIAGEMAGRGISFTSSDHEWHLSEQFFLPSNRCDEPELIQKIRLCGRYRDRVPLKLYTTAAVWSDIKKADARLEEVVSRVKASEDTSKDTIYNMSLYKEKFTSRDMTKTYGTPITKSDVLAGDEVQDEYDVEETDVDRVKRNIERHLRSSRTTNVAVFLSSLDPSQSYAKEDLIGLLREAKYQQPDSMLRSFLKKADYGGVGGNIFTKVGNQYTIMAELQVCWNN